MPLALCPTLLVTCAATHTRPRATLQEAVRPATVVTVISLSLAPLYNYLLIYRMGLGLYGAAYAMDAMQASGHQHQAASRPGSKPPPSFLRCCLPCSRAACHSLPSPA